MCSITAAVRACAVVVVGRLEFGFGGMSEGDTFSMLPVPVDGVFKLTNGSDPTRPPRLF